VSILHNIPLYNSEGEPELVSIDVDYSDNGFKVIVNACTVITKMKSIPSDEIVDIQTGIARALNLVDEDENPELWRVVVECEITVGKDRHIWRALMRASVTSLVSEGGVMTSHATNQRVLHGFSKVE
jgi:hypothetical protein